MTQKDELRIETALEYANSIIATLREPFLVLDKNLQIISANQAFYTAFQITEKDVMARSLPDLGNGQWNIPKLLQLLKEIIPEKKAVKDYEIAHKFEQISEKVMLLNASQLSIPKKIAGIMMGVKEEGEGEGEGEEELILLAIEDVTEKRKIEEELKKAQMFLDSSVDASHIGVWVLDLINDTAIRNLRSDQIFGYNEKLVQWGAKKFLEHVVTEDRPSVQAAYEGAIKTGKLYFECRILWPDKSIHWIVVIGKTEKDSAGKPQKMYGTVMDITEHKVVEERLIYEKEFLKNILDNVQAIILILDNAGKIISINKYMEKISGYRLDEVKGKDWFETFLPDRIRSNTREVFKKAVTNNKTKGNINVIVTKDGSELDIEWYDETLKDKNGNVIGLISLGQNLTERRKAEELNKANVIAEAANRAKSEFLADMSHELRTPLNSIGGFSEVLFDETFGPLNEKQKQYVSYILTSGKHLLFLINQILDMGTIEAGKMKLALSSLSMKSLLNDVSALLVDMISKKQIEMSLEIDEDLPNIEADEFRVKEIIYILISNAVKFTPSGGKIGIRAKKINSEIEVVVWDNGIGIAPENMDNLFEKFFRVDNQDNRIEGAGLGLVLSKKLVELHGGNISVKSGGLNKGTEVRFTLPIVYEKKV